MTLACLKKYIKKSFNIIHEYGNVINIHVQGGNSHQQFEQRTS
jgi:hypothetical protein